jgi:hypothetical protein
MVCLPAAEEPNFSISANKAHSGIIITAFPERLSKENGKSILNHAWNSIRNSKPLTASSLIIQLLRVFINAIAEPFNAGLNESLFSIFEYAIADQVLSRSSYYAFRVRTDTHSKAKQQIRLYKDYRNVGAQRQDPRSEPNAEGRMGIIKLEMECSRVTMDIKDELVMIDLLIQDQRAAIDQLADYCRLRKEQAMKVSSFYSVELQEDMQIQFVEWEGLLQAIADIRPTIHSKLDKIGRLIKRVDLVDNGVSLLTTNIRFSIKQQSLMSAGKINKLLDLKLKHSSLEEAENTLLLAKENAKQSNLLFMFTVVTVFFVRRYPIASSPKKFDPPIGSTS